MTIQKKHEDGIASYLINDYCDLRDVIFTIEKMIADTTAVRNKMMLREKCQITMIPLKDKTSFILRIKLHEAMLDL